MWEWIDKYKGVGVLAFMFFFAVAYLLSAFSGLWLAAITWGIGLIATMLFVLLDIQE